MCIRDSVLPDWNRTLLGRIGVATELRDQKG